MGGLGANGKDSILPAIDAFRCLAYLSAMTIRPITKLPDEKVLRQESKALARIDADARKLMDDMLETMYDAPGIGLAAIQIAVPARLIVIDTAKEGEDPRPLFIANPEITWRSEELGEYEEGCLSIPEFFELVQRPREVKLRYVDRKGEVQDMHATGLLATVIQHEFDHLNGVLFIDHISKLKRDRVVKKFQKAQKLGKL